jgi:hypothetical protein
MFYPYSVLKLIHEERLREMMAQNYVYSQINKREDSRVKESRTGRIRRLISNFSLPSISAWRYPEPVRTTQTGIDLNECQATSECSPC